MFASEQDMSSKFEKFLKENFGNAYIKEQAGLFGVPDYIFYSKSSDEILIISFELKLRDWKRASIQAFRYNNFSNLSYVVLPLQNINSAINNIDHFEKYNIGLASFNGGDDFEIIYKPQNRAPYSELMNQRVKDSVVSSRKRAKSIATFI